MKWASDAVVVEFVKQLFVGDGVESLGKIQYSNIDLLSLVIAAAEFIHGCHKLGFAGKARPEAMVFGCQDAIFFKMMHDVSAHNVFQ